MRGRETALGLAAEDVADRPGSDLHLQARGVRRLDDVSHRLAVEGEVVLAERVQDAREAAGSERLHVGGDVAHDAIGEVGDARAHGHLSRSARFGYVTTNPSVSTTSG